MKINILFIILFFMCSCANNAKIKREKANYTEITDSLYTSFPGSMFYTGKYIVWTDPFSDIFINVVDAQTGKTVKSIVKIGQGPNEFTTPEVSVYNEDTIYIRDLNENKESYIPLNADNKDYIVTEMKDRRFHKSDKYLPISANQWLSFGTYEGEELPFAFANGSEYTRFGKYPFSEAFENKYLCQGGVAYNRERQILVYSSVEFPYMASYKIDEDVSLIWENAVKIDYTLVNNNIKLSKKHHSHSGGVGLTLTQNYIVTEEYDYEVDKVEQPKGRDLTKVPHKLFIRNYDGELVRIIDVEKPVVRMAGNESSDFVYAIIIDQEFEIVKIDCGNNSKLEQHL